MLSFYSDRRIFFALAGLILGLILSLLTAHSDLRFQDFRLSQVAGDRTAEVTLPYLAPGWGRGVYRLEGVMTLDWFAPQYLQIIPDDKMLRVEVNGQPVDLSSVPARRLQDVNQGFALDLSPFLSRGDNRVLFEFRDFGGQMGVAVKPWLGDWRWVSLIVGWGLLAATLLLWGLRWLGVPLKHGVCYCLVVLGGLVQVWYIFQYNPVDHIFSDPQRHWEQGTDVLRTDLMALTDPILYQAYIAVLAKFTLKIPALVAYCTSLLALVGPWLWYRFFRELQTSKTLALAGWAFLSLLPSWTAIYAYFMQETLMLPLLGAALWATWRCRRKADVRSFCLMVFLWILAGLTRGITIPMAAVCCTWLWLAQDLKWQKAVFSSVVMLLIMGPLTFRSYVMVDHFAPHGMGHLNVIYAQSGKKTIEISSRRAGAGWVHIFGSPSTGAEPFAPFSDWKTQRTGKVRVDVDLDKGTADWDAAKDAVDMGWRDYLWITKENLIFMFFAQSWPDNNNARLVDAANSVMRWVWAPVFIVILLGFALSAARLRGNWLLPSVLAAWFVVQNLIPISVNEGRYRKPFEGLAVASAILIMGAYAGRLRQPAPAQPWLKPALARMRSRGAAARGDDSSGEQARSHDAVGSDDVRPEVDPTTTDQSDAKRFEV